MNNKNGKRDPDDMLAVLRMMFYIVRELEVLGHASEAADVKATATRLQKRVNITDEQLFPSGLDD